ncbi:MAG: hypothetical protein AAF514_18630 [Verrucomicrobiota bacterium]
MQNKNIACFIIFLLSAACLYVGFKMKSKAEGMKALALSAKKEAEQALYQRKLADKNLSALQNKSAAVLDYYKLWKPHFDSTNSSETIEREVLALIKEGKLLSLNKKFAKKPNPKDPYFPEIWSASLVFESDYMKIMNWFGKFESNMPTSRITKLGVEKGATGNDVRLELNIEIPILTDDPDTALAIAKKNA